jgi:MinD superfamily P-loop ATPase
LVISVASGKGGTGKTTIATSLALATSNSQYLDCDVEEPNGHLFLKPTFTQQEPVVIQKPSIIPDRCTYCGDCADLCHFNALAVFPDNVLLFDHLCHGCGVCSLFCPEHAIQEVDHEIGILKFGYCDNTLFGYGILTVGEALASPVIRKLKKSIHPDRVVILDAPPGTHCPVVETVHDTDYCILVTEATPFGLHDLKLAVEMLKNMDIPHGVIINKYDLGNDQVENFCQNAGIPVLLRIPFDRKIAECYSRGELLIDAKPEYKYLLSEVLKKIQYEQIIEKAG